eukprot:TRINITY_DN4550_c1_g1_i6.p2 TRINITY_DN4550_c1_g1~~TRINITY_DN4550_c1_g1_i6.p2  ORF type:complete len:121 (+),score=7.99 TRINITY_DN4550_c1_g1_i6:169-531(+)
MNKICSKIVLLKKITPPPFSYLANLKPSKILYLFFICLFLLFTFIFLQQQQQQYNNNSPNNLQSYSIKISKQRFIVVGNLPIREKLSNYEQNIFKKQFTQKNNPPPPHPPPPNRGHKGAQ